MSVKRIRQAVRDGSYEFTTHALEEMDEDALTDEEVRDVLLRGKLVLRLTDDPRGIRFVIRGLCRSDQVEVEVVCRFLPSGLMRIITTYAIEERQ
jgi:hypothetical protein